MSFGSLTPGKLAPAGLKPELEGRFLSGHLQFVLTGFTHETGFRVFTFEKMGPDRVWTRCIVKADLALIRHYGIHIQELPLLCRALLERPPLDGALLRTLTFTEAEMRVCATDRAAAKDLAKKRKVPHRPGGETPGAAWRGVGTSS
jgi:hypothetical protein